MPEGHIYDPGDGTGLALRIVNRDGTAVSAGGGGGTSMTDDAAFTPGVSSVTPMGALADETLPDSVDEGDVGVVRMTLTRALHVNLRDSSGSEVSVGGGTQYDEDSAHVSGDKLTMAGVVRQDAATALSGTDGDRTALISDAFGRLHVNVGNTVTVASHDVTNAGTFATQVDGSALTALQKIDDPVLVDDAAFTPATSSVMMAGFQADETSTDSVDEGDAGAARMTLTRKVITTPQPHTTGGLLIHKNLDVDETEDEIKASAGQIYGWYFANRATSVRYIKFYNATALNVTVGTTTPVLTIPLPGNSTDVIAANALGTMGIAFDTAICIAATTGFADNDTGAPGTNDVLAMVFYL